MALRREGDYIIRVKTMKNKIYNILTRIWDRTEWCPPLQSFVGWLRYEVFYPKGAPKEEYGTYILLYKQLD